MKSYLKPCLAVILSLPFTAHADTTLVYELVDAAGEKTQQTYTIRGRFLRVDKDAETSKNFLLLDGGFLYMNVVDGEKGTFTTFGDSPYHQGQRLPAKPKPGNTAATGSEQAGKANAKSPPLSVLSPTVQKDSVAGIRCRIVNELRDGTPVAEHCLADPAALGMTPRELISMARLIEFAKQRTDPDWIAIQSDEQFITIRSRPAEGEPTFVLKSVSHEIASRDLFRVPPAYQKLEPEDDYAGLITGRK
ncbi:MAG: hypothetical protein ABF290_00090 [Thiogranum sp.]